MQEALSNHETYQLMIDPFGENSPLAFKKDLSAEQLEQSPMFKLFYSILTKIETAGELKLTQKGNFPRAFCQQLYNENFFKDYNVDKFKKGKINQQDDWIHLDVAHAVLNISSLVKKRYNKFSLTKKGKQLLKNPPELFKELLQVFCMKYNWGYTDLYPERVAQNGAAFSLYLFVRFQVLRLKDSTYLI